MTLSSPRRRGSDAVPDSIGDSRRSLPSAKAGGGNDEKSARTDALKLLKFRPRSEAELRERLSRKGHGPSEQEAVLEELRKKGLLDDAKFARLLVAQRVMSKPVGRRMLLSRLKGKGIDPELAARAVEAGTEGWDEGQVARALAIKRVAQLRELPRETVKRRLFGYLSRRGFSSDVVYRVVREVTAAGGHPRPRSESGAGSGGDP